jgi:hypothetical protein
METEQGISLHNSLSQTSKNTMLFLLPFMFFLLQKQRIRRQNRFCLEVRLRGGGLAQILYTHVSKFKNNIIK